MRTGGRDCFLDDPTRRRQVLTGAASLHRSAMRRPAPTRPCGMSGFGLDEYSGYKRCGGCRYSSTCCGGSRIGVSTVSSSGPPGRGPPRVGTAWRRNGKLSWAFLGLEQMIVFRRSRVQRLQGVLGHRQTHDRVLLPRYKLELNVGHTANPPYVLTS